MSSFRGGGKVAEFIVYSDCDERRNLVDFTTGPDIPKLGRKTKKGGVMNPVGVTDSATLATPTV